MVDKVYIVWCKLNKSTDKFDLGVYIDKQEADKNEEHFKPISAIWPKVWVQEYKLSQTKGKL